MTSELKKENDEKHDILKTIKSGFIIWSWVALLGAYTSTSGILIMLEYQFLQRGIEAYNLSNITLTIFMMAILFPMLNLLMGWFVFIKYSITIFDISIFQSSTSNEILEKSKWLFRRSISYLMYAYIFGIAAGTSAIIFNYFIQRIRI